MKTKENLIQFNCKGQNPYIFIGNIYFEHKRKDKIENFMVEVKLIVKKEFEKDFLTRIENVKKVDENGNLIKDASSSLINRYLIPAFSKIVFVIESQFISKLNEEINNNQIKLNDLKKGF